MATEKKLNKAYDRGWSACRRGKPLVDNPYHMATAAMAANSREWERGWMAVWEEDFKAAELK
jgi:hypothetical protein